MPNAALLFTGSDAVSKAAVKELLRQQDAPVARVDPDGDSDQDWQAKQLEMRQLLTEWYNEEMGIKQKITGLAAIRWGLAVIVLALVRAAAA
ncbi:hypothetical protein HYH03_008302 [Edaphochlamys debaryana]|uniref:Uncharacterized protein n=1 Tax=Edaphochlamys debaryana TaxID=47281 RepID=A0A835Y084_9CHLO|nr:hypothetical protein HYH03_008302 [Edaphochlamys debaryana]|eukprot:KAG2493486.1 hypothetical protein HYH03_008302 [Edaphochlamys debaryana]